MTESAKEEYILAGDIGGTKTNLGIFQMGKRRPLVKRFKSYPSGDFEKFEEIIALFLSENNEKVKKACFGIAGPVEKERCKITNLSWDVSSSRIKKTFNLKSVKLVNDLGAMAASVPYLTSSEIFKINEERPEKNGNIALIAPGTGLGQSLLVYGSGKYIPVPSEGGHVDFAPNNDLEDGLLKFLRKQYGHVSLERIISGIGILNIYNYLKATGKYKEPRWLEKRIASEDSGKVINESAQEKGNKLCLKTIDMFLSILGASAGNLALTGLTRGGVYIGGGIPPRLLWRFMDGSFMKAFSDKGRFKGLMTTIPVYIILNSSAGLLGAAVEAFGSE